MASCACADLYEAPWFLTTLLPHIYSHFGGRPNYKPLTAFINKINYLRYTLYYVNLSKNEG